MIYISDADSKRLQKLGELQDELRRMRPVFRAAMKWAKQYNCYRYPKDWNREFETALAKACAKARGK